MTSRCGASRNGLELFKELAVLSGKILTLDMGCDFSNPAVHLVAPGLKLYRCQTGLQSFLEKSTLGQHVR